MKILNEKELFNKITEKGGKSLQPPAYKNEQEEMAQQQESKSIIKKTLLGLLSRREYSQKELRDKIYAKGFDVELGEIILEDFVQKDYQSDERYCEMLIRSRVLKQSGPFKIRMELKQKGIAENLSEAVLQNVEVDWFELAKEAAIKKSESIKFGTTFEEKQKAKAKLVRFLQGRGFDSEQLNYALESLGI